jgi:hypothetical protein
MEMSQLLSKLVGYAQNQVSSLAHWRDGSLVIGGALYFLGYLAWCLHAWWINLSLLPALSSQYIMAGGILGSFLVAIAILRFLRECLLVWLDPPVKWKLLARWAILVALICEFLLGLILFFAPFFSTRATEIVAIVFLTTSLLAVPVPRWREALETLKATITKIKNKRVRDFLGSMVDRLSRLLSRVVQWIEHDYPSLATYLLCGIGLVFTIIAFLAMPQQLGGVHPRCAYLDIEKNTISTELRGALSVQLDVLFAGSDSIFVRPKKSDSTIVYEISRKMVQTITWCD